MCFKVIYLTRELNRVVLMSATVDAERFSKYLNNAPVLTVPGRTFPVKVQYLEDAIELTKYKAEEPDPLRRGRSRAAIEDWEEPDGDEGGYEGGPVKPVENISTTLAGYSKETKVALSKIDLYQIPYDLVMKLIEAVATNPDYVDYSKAILVFLPGIAEIRRLNDHLLGHPMFGGGISSRGDNHRHWVIYPLHSTIASEEQEAAFLVPPPGVRKIVLATNIAETGITIPDVTCVIDVGKHKEMRYVSPQFSWDLNH